MWWLSACSSRSNIAFSSNLNKATDLWQLRTWRLIILNFSIKWPLRWYRVKLHLPTYVYVYTVPTLVVCDVVDKFIVQENMRTCTGQIVALNCNLHSNRNSYPVGISFTWLLCGNRMLHGYPYFELASVGWVRRRGRGRGGPFWNPTPIRGFHSHAQ